MRFCGSQRGQCAWSMWYTFNKAEISPVRLKCTLSRTSTGNFEGRKIFLIVYYIDRSSTNLNIHCTLRLCVHWFCTSCMPVDHGIKSFLSLLNLYYTTYLAFYLFCLSSRACSFETHISMLSSTMEASTNSWELQQTLGPCSDIATELLFWLWQTLNPYIRARARPCTWHKTF